MKRNLLVAVLLGFCLHGAAQWDVQMHYDFGRTLNRAAEPTRPNLTTTVQYVNVDKVGLTFGFIDLDYYSNGVTGAYMEALKQFNVAQTSPNSTLALQVEYNGGFKMGKEGGCSRYQPAGLAGAAWNWHSNDYKTNFALRLLYKQYFQQTIAEVRTNALSTFQATMTWNTTFANGKLNFTGFVDLWRGYIPDWDETGKQKVGLVLATEPQLWYNVTNKFAVGTEWEITNNFVYAANGKKFIVNPTVAVKVKL